MSTIRVERNIAFKLKGPSSNPRRNKKDCKTKGPYMTPRCKSKTDVGGSIGILETRCRLKMYIASTLVARSYEDQELMMRILRRSCAQRAPLKFKPT